MKKVNIRNKNGITLMAEAITVILLLIIISIISYSSISNLKVKKLNNMYSDITTIQEKAANYYLKYGKAPITTETVPEDIVNALGAEKNPNDVEGEYYKVDISALSNISLNNMPTDDGYYFMNASTLTTYYSKGVSIENLNNVESKTFHTIPNNYDKITQVNGSYYLDDMVVPIVSIDTDGKVWWENIVGATSYQISFDNENWVEATSGEKTIDKTTTGEKTAYVRAICSSRKFKSPSEPGSATVSVHSLALNKGKGISEVTGVGNYVEGKIVTLAATAKTGYTFNDEWTLTSGVTSVLSGDGKYITINENTELQATATANELSFNEPNKSATYSTSKQNINPPITGAINGTGDYTYTKKSEKNSSNTDTNYISISGKTLSLAANTPAGTYAYTVTATDKESGAFTDATITITVNKANSTNPTLTDPNADYDGKVHYIGVSGGSGGTIYYRTSSDNSSWGSWSTTKPSSMNAGTVHVQAYVVGDSNHNDTTATKSQITIKEVAATAPSLTDTKVYYDGSAHSIGVLSTGSGGTINYSTSLDGSSWGSWSTTKPSLTAPGTKYVKAKVVGDKNHNDSTESAKKVIKVKYEIYTIQNVNQSHFTYNDAACTSDYDTITCSRFYNKTIEVKYVGKYANSQDILHGGWSKIYQIVGGTFCTNNCWPGMKNKYIKLPQNWDDGYVGGSPRPNVAPYPIRFIRTSTLD